MYFLYLPQCGFFRRKLKEDLDCLKRALDAEREALTDSLSGGSNELMLPGENSPHLPLEAIIDHRFFYPRSEMDANSEDEDDGLRRKRSSQPIEFFHNENRRERQRGKYNPSYFHSSSTMSYPSRTSSTSSNGLPSPVSNPESSSFPGPVYSAGRGRIPNSRGTIPGPRRNNSDWPHASNLWVAPPASAPPPSFNNEMYLEPVETRG